MRIMIAVACLCLPAIAAAKTLSPLEQALSRKLGVEIDGGCREKTEKGRNGETWIGLIEHRGALRWTEPRSMMSWAVLNARWSQESASLQNRSG